MATIIQQKIFRWKDVEKSSEIERLMMVIETMPDDELMKELELERKGRRDDYPIRAVRLKKGEDGEGRIPKFFRINLWYNKATRGAIARQEVYL